MDVVLKQRLVGAIVLVALGVIFIPMLLEGPNETLVPKMDEMPAPEVLAPELPLRPFPPAGEPAQAERAVITDSTREEASAPADTEPPGPLPAAAPEPAEVVPPQVVKPPEKSAPDEVPTEVATKGSWIVQVVSLSNRENALALRDRLRKGGFATQVEQVRVDGKTHHRVRVGPFLEQDEAERVRAQIAERFEQNGRVMSWP